MAAQASENFLLQLDVSGAGNFLTVGGLNGNQVSQTLTPVDVTTKESPGGQRQYGSGMGLVAVEFSGTLTYQNDPVMRRVQDIWQERAAVRWRTIRTKTGERWVGPFVITNLQAAGQDAKGAETAQLTLGSAGFVEFLRG